MAIIAQELSIADYNKLDNIPVINQDLSTSGFTPVANTYYKHTGATTDTFTQGVIYLYDTAYHKLGESGGSGMQLKALWEGDVTIAGANLSSAAYNITLNEDFDITKPHFIDVFIPSENTQYDGGTVNGYGRLAKRRAIIPATVYRGFDNNEFFGSHILSATMERVYTEVTGILDNTSAYGTMNITKIHICLSFRQKAIESSMCSCLVENEDGLLRTNASQDPKTMYHAGRFKIYGIYELTI